MAISGNYSFDSSAPDTLQSRCGTGGVGTQPRSIPEGRYLTTEGDDVTNSHLSSAWNGKPVAGVWRLTVIDSNVNTGRNQFVTNADWKWQLTMQVTK